MEGFVSGLHRSPYKGFSVEFMSYRPYIPGDDLMRVDWKLFARTDRFYVKETEDETNTSINLLLDVSHSMGYGSRQITKLKYASYLLASLAYLAVRQRDAVGVTFFDDDIIEHIPARSTKGHLHTILSFLEGVELGARTEMGKPLHALAERQHHRGFVILMSIVVLVGLFVWQLSDPPELQRSSRAQRAAYEIRQAVQESHLGEPVEVRRLQPPEGDEENAVIVVQDLLDEAAKLKPYESHCQGCPANRTGTPFGCTGFIQYPLTAKGEAWLLNQLPAPQEPLIWLLLKQGVDNFQYDGQQVAQLRQTDDTYFEARQPARRSLGEFTLTANQVFEMMFMVGNIIPNHAGVLLLFFNAVERERMQADSIMQMAPSTPEKVSEYPFMHQMLPSDDRTTREIKAFLHALYIAWALNEKLLVDA